MPRPIKPKRLSELSPYVIQAHERAVRNGERLAEHWAALGYKVKVTIEPVHQQLDGKPTAAIIGFAVASDMVNGLPRDYGRELPPPPPKIRRRRSDEGGGLFHY